MTTNLTSYKADLQKLLKLGQSMDLDPTFRHFESTGKLKPEQKKIAKELQGSFESNYQKWFTESLAVIRQLIPDRFAEFEQLYKGDGKRRKIDATTYHILDWLNGVRIGNDPYSGKKSDDFAGVTMRFRTQLSILGAVEGRFESTLLISNNLFRRTYSIRSLMLPESWRSVVFCAVQVLLPESFLRNILLRSGKRTAYQSLRSIRQSVT